jgi:hypothetical protein
MARKPNPKPTDPVQSKRFLETAKDLRIDGDGAVFNRAIDLLLSNATQKTVPSKVRKKAKP